MIDVFYHLFYPSSKFLFEKNYFFKALFLIAKFAFKIVENDFSNRWNRFSRQPTFIRFS